MQELRKILILCLFGFGGFIVVFLFFNDNKEKQDSLSKLDLRDIASQNMQILNLDSKEFNDNVGVDIESLHVENANLVSNQKNNLKDSVSKDSKIVSSDINSNKDSNIVESKIIESKNKNKDNKTKYNTKPYVVIIIDDLANTKDIKRFYDLDLRLNLSLFPKYSFSKDNPKIAKTLPFFMIHLPLEAQNFSQKGVRVINVGEEEKSINEFITQIKSDFPALKYLNNHTGSKFSASINDMKTLLNVLEKHKITFVDSVTTAKSAAAILFKDKKNTPYLHRNVFLDNENNEKYITNQLESALKFAHKNGYVIAIGHPKNQTYNVLKANANRLKTQYNMIYINELDNILRQHHNDGISPLKHLDSNTINTNMKHEKNSKSYMKSKNKDNIEIK